MKRKILQIALISLVAFTVGCGSKESQTDQQTKTAEATEEKLSITPENLVQVENEFKIDYFAAAEKYAGKKVQVVATCTGVNMTTTIIPHADLEGYFVFFEYLKKDTFTKAMPAAIAKTRSLTLTTDLVPTKWQPIIHLSDGRTLGYDNLLFKEDNEYYLIYDKKNDQIVFDEEVAETISLYIRAHRATTENRAETIAHIDGYVKDKLFDNVYADLMAGNFYYYSEEIDWKGTAENGFMNGPKTISLVPCIYVIEGTVSKDILDNNINLVNSKIVKTDWLIDKSKFFKNQILY